VSCVVFLNMKSKSGKNSLQLLYTFLLDPLSIVTFSSQDASLAKVTVNSTVTEVLPPTEALPFIK